VILPTALQRSRWVLEQLVWFHLTRCAGKKPLANDICVIQLTGRWRTRTSLDPRGTLVESYLKSRKLEIGDDIAGRVLRWHPGTSAMVALFRSVRTDEPLAISRTFLNSQRAA
jgi:hypothetical protein